MKTATTELTTRSGWASFWDWHAAVSSKECFWCFRFSTFKIVRFFDQISSKQSWSTYRSFQRVLILVWVLKKAKSRNSLGLILSRKNLKITKTSGCLWISFLKTTRLASSLELSSNCYLTLAVTYISWYIVVWASAFLVIETFCALDQITLLFTKRNMLLRSFCNWLILWWQRQKLDMRLSN